MADAPADGDVAEPDVSLLVLPVVPPLMLLPPVAPVPDVEPVPVAPIEVVPLVLGEVVVSVLAVPEPLMDDEPVVDPGEVEAVDGLVEVEPGEVADDVLLASRLLHAPRERAATTASAEAVAWVRVIFIGKLLERERVFAWDRKGSRDCPDTTLGRPGLRSVGSGSKRV